jgi:predicted MFS family arabinose efflux permease
LSAAGIRALVPRLVRVEARDRANALDTSIHGLTDIVGPALAGVLVGFVGAAPTFILIAILYATTAICVGRIRTPHPRAVLLPALLRTAWTGFVRVSRAPTLRAMALSYSLYQVTWGALLVVVPVVAARHVAGGAGQATAGLLWAGSGVVGVIGTLIAGRLRTLGRERPTMALGMGITALAAGPVAATHGLFGLALGLMLIAAAAGPVDIAVLTLRQRRTDPVELGRVLSVSMSLNLAGIPLGSALAGVLLPWSLPAAFAAAGLASLLAAGATALIPRDDVATDG